MQKEEKIDMNLQPSGRNIPPKGRIKYYIVGESALKKKILILDPENEDSRVSRQAKELLAGSSAWLEGYIEGVPVYLDPNREEDTVLICWTRDSGQEGPVFASSDVPYSFVYQAYFK
jgi:hypothetical protein